MKNKFFKFAFPIVVLGFESTLGYLYSMIGPDHAGLLGQLEQDLAVKLSFKLFGLVLSFLAARLAFSKLESGRKICRAAACGMLLLSLLLLAGDAGAKEKKLCKKPVRKVELATLI